MRGTNLLKSMQMVHWKNFIFSPLGSSLLEVPLYYVWLIPPSSYRDIIILQVLMKFPLTKEEVNLRKSLLTIATPVSHLQLLLTVTCCIFVGNTHQQFWKKVYRNRYDVIITSSRSPVPRELAWTSLAGEG